jgi:hypothetical protein
MKKNIILNFKMITMVIVLLVVTNSTNAQPNPGPGNSGSTTTITTDGPTVPLDGGMSLLLLASGISYGAKKMRKKK